VKIDVAIERLVVEGIPVTAADRARLTESVELELGELLGARGVGPELLGAGSVPRLDGGTVDVARSDPGQLGRGIAGAVHRGLAR
jgi:hypothetical protein